MVMGQDRGEWRPIDILEHRADDHRKKTVESSVGIGAGWSKTAG